MTRHIEGEERGGGKKRSSGWLQARNSRDGLPAGSSRHDSTRGRGAGVNRKSETPRELFTLDVAEGHGESVGGIGGLGSYLHFQKGAHHQLHLFFVGVPIASHTSFHFARRIGKDFNAMLLRGKQHDAAHFGE